MIVHQLILLFGLIITGYIINKLGIMDGQANAKFSKLLVNVSIPATIIHSAASQTMEGGDLVKMVFIISIAYYIIIPFVSMFFAKILHQKPTYQLMLTYSNLGFMGIPIISSIYGDSAVFYVTIFMMIFNVSIFSQGIFILSKEGDSGKGMNLKNLMNPGVLCAVLALIIFVFQIPVQSDIDNLLKSIGSITTPLAMIVIGSSLAEIPLKSVFLDKSMYLFAVLKLLVYPCLLLIPLKILGVDSMVIGLCVILSSLPTAGNVSMVCSEYGGDLELISKGICISTLLSVLAIPLWITVVSFL